MRTAILIALVFAGTLAADMKEDAPPPKFPDEQVAFYEKQVLPILKEHCYKCHTGKKVRGKLWLDSRAAILRGGDLGPAVIPGKLDESPLVKALHYKTEGLEMPPDGKLPQAKIDTLVKWAALGLPFTPGKEAVVKGHERLVVTDKDREWWAYRPLARPAPPALKTPGWVTTPPDAFVLAKLEANGLKPAKPAGRVALARRVYYGLTGLPPTPEQIDDFVNDARPDAYSRLVESLLASPAYGEKWARHWLDLVRYAESHGYERDSAKPFAWRYRDWVVRAFNSNMPYDRFVKQQLAGDLLSPGDADSLIATGYYRLGIWDDEPADRLQAKYDVLDGVVSTTSSVFLGMSVGCARCHDHKKDPIPQRDYYRLLAYFRDVTDMSRENLRKVSTGGPAREALVKSKQAREARAYQKVHALEQELLAEVARKKGADVSAFVGSDIEDLTFRYYRDAWHELPDFAPLTPVHEGKLAGGRFTLEAAPEKDRMALVFEGKLKVPAAGEHSFDVLSSDGVRLLIDGKRVLDRPGKGKAVSSGKATLRAGLLPIRLEYFNTVTPPALNVTWSGPGFKDRPLSGGAAGGVLVADSRNQGQTWRYTLTAPRGPWLRPDYNDAAWKEGQGGFGTRGTPGSAVRTVWRGKDIWLRKTFTVAGAPSSLTLDLHHDDDVEVYLNSTKVYEARGYLVDYKRITLPADAVKPGDNVLAIHCRQIGGGQYIDAGLTAEGTGLDGLLRKHGDPAKVKTLNGLRAELASIRAEKIPDGVIDVMCVTEAGKAKTHVLTRGNPHAPAEEVSDGTPEVLGEPAPPGRRELAEWIVGPKNPIAARAMANRVWQYHFGRGLVGTGNDFGKLGETPTHPELLDWLASELIASGWDLKHLHRVILHSSAYRMSSAGDAAALAKDGANMLLWRFPMRRLSAEEVRDSILAASGRLSRRMEGPPVYPPIPAAVLAGQSVPGAGWGKSSPEEASRRSVYVHVKRSLLLPILETHDAADTDSSCAARYTTTVPTQALGMLNGEFTNEQARLFADRLLAEEKDLAGVVRRAVRLTTGRTASADEVKRDVAFIERLMKEDALDQGRAVANYCLLSINANEFVYVD